MTVVYQTCLEMCEQREYTVEKKLKYEIHAVNKHGEQIYFYFIPYDKINIDIFKYYVTLMDKLSIYHAIFVYRKTITPFVKKILQTLQLFNIEIFCQDELTYNVTKHQLVPKHTKTRLPSKIGLKNIPKISRTDPVVRFLGFKVGDVVKIERKNGTLGYRVVK